MQIQIMFEIQNSGITETFGNHVGDGDSNSIRFQNGSPAEIYLSVHS